jgi:type I restriction enzyme S subunit
MLASERFGRQLFSRNLSRYRIARRDSIVLDPMLLWDGSIGRQAIVGEGLVSPDYRVYRCHEVTDPEFMGYLVRSSLMARHHRSGARGTNVRRNRIARTDFQRIPVLIPPLSEQRKIAAILSSIDDVIESERTLGEFLLSSLKPVLARQLLTSGLPGRHTRFQQTGLGLLPGSWRVSSLNDVCTKITDGTHRSPKPQPEGYLYVTSKNIRPFRLDLSDPIFISEADHREIWSRCDVQLGDVLLTKDGANTGNTALNSVPQPFSLLSSVALLRTGPFLLPQFLCQFLNSTVGRVQSSLAMEGLAIKRLTIEKIRTMLVPVPPVEEQALLCRVLASVDDRIFREEEEVSALERLKKSLARDLLSGKTRVSSAEAIA